MRARTPVAVLLLAGLLAAPLIDWGCLRRVYTNGSYQAVSQADSHGYAWAKVNIQSDKIKSVELKEFTEKAVEKDYATYPWPEAKVAHDTLPARFVAKNSWDVDVVAKATGSSDKYKEAVKLALEKARRKPAVTGAYFDGTFMGRSAADAFGYGVVLVTVKNGAISDVVLNEVTPEGALKDWETYPYQPAKTARTTMTDRFKGRAAANVAQVDVVAAATSSCTKWKQAVEAALASARVK